MEPIFPTIYLKEFDKWNATKQNCPKCMVEFANAHLVLDTLRAKDGTEDQYLMFYTNCPCGSMVYIVPDGNERIYVTGSRAVSSKDLAEVYAHVRAGNSLLSTIATRHDVQWKITTDMFGFFEDWKDSMSSKIVLLQEYEAEHARKTITWQYKKEQEEHIRTCMLYDHKGITELLPEDLKEKVKNEDVLEIEHESDKLLVHYHYRPAPKIFKDDSDFEVQLMERVDELNGVNNTE